MEPEKFVLDYHCDYCATRGPYPGLCVDCNDALGAATFEAAQDFLVDLTEQPPGVSQTEAANNGHPHQTDN